MACAWSCAVVRCVAGCNQREVYIVSSLFLLQVKVKAKDLRGKKKEELLKQLEELKTVSINRPPLAPPGSPKPSYWLKKSFAYCILGAPGPAIWLRVGVSTRKVKASATVADIVPAQAASSANANAARKTSLAWSGVNFQK